MVLSVDLLRPDDLLCLTIETHNLRLDTSVLAQPVLVREDDAQDAFLIAIFPPQSFGEQALLETDGSSDLPLPPGELEARMAGRSRLAFLVPPNTTIPFTTAGLLDWTRYEPHLTAIGTLRGQPFFLRARAPKVRLPSSTETAIELPYRLILSPGPDSRWRHDNEPSTLDGRTALWHTRLVEGGAEGAAELGNDNTAPVRAIYSPDFVEGGSQQSQGAFTTSLQPFDRNNLVKVMSTFSSGLLPFGRKSDQGQPAQISHLALSALGACLDVRGRWGSGSLSISSWTHRAALGRDNFVQVTYRGRLFPLMNRATYILTTERRVESSPVDVAPVAYLRKYARILIDEPEVSYVDEDFAHEGREMPFARMRVDVALTPKIEIPNEPGGSFTFIEGTQSFEIRLNDSLWKFPLTGTDRAGNRVGISMGLIFVNEEDIPENLDRINNHYSTIGPNERYATGNNSRIKVADFENDSDTSTFVAGGFEFGVDLRGNSAGFLPTMSRMDLRVPSLEEITGSAQAVSLIFNQSYLDVGFDLEAGLFAEIAGGGSLGLKFGASQTGGIANPNMNVRGFSRTFGPIAGELSGVANGVFDIKKAFEGIEAKLFGAIDLIELLSSSLLTDSSPRITVDPLPNASMPTELVTRMAWDAPTGPVEIPVKYEPSAQTRLKVEVTVRKPINDPGAAPITIIEGRLNKFSITLLNSLKINFDEFKFSSGGGRSPDVSVDLDDAEPVIFLGGLEFVNKMNELLPPGLFGPSGPRVTLKPTAVEVGFAIGLPPAALGAFTITNVALGASLTLPFLEGRPSFAIFFSTREKPFQLSVTLFGGGGFIKVELDTTGIKSAEVMLEFGGVFALDVGVAGGSIQVMAGIYVGLGAIGTELTGYVRYAGELTVMRVVSVSVEFIVSLSYLGHQTVRGRAEVTLTVRVAFLSKPVSFSVERKFSAGSRHVSIGETMSAADWANYALAFEGG